MHKPSWLLLSAIIVIVIDTISWFARDWLVAGISGSFIILAVSILGGAGVAILVRRRMRTHEEVLILPDGRRLTFRSADDTTAQILALQRQLMTRVEQMSERFATRQDTEHLLVYLKAVEREAQARSEREQVSQRTQAVLTTLIGLVGGWLPSLIAMTTSHLGH